MESIVFEDSPLAEYLQGEGNGGAEWVESYRDSSEQPSPSLHSFAPRQPSTLHRRIRDKLPRPLKLPIPQNSPIARIRRACRHAINSRPGKADDARFLEHFRYVIVASQLLDERSGQGALKPTAVPQLNLDGVSEPLEYKEYQVSSISLQGAVATGLAAFVVVWLLHWARAGKQWGFSKSRLIAVFAACTFLGVLAYAYTRRQLLHLLRQQAVEAASNLVTNLQAFDASTSSAVLLIQEVELVSRGYRLSSPLPPITRLEGKDQTRRCCRLRKSLLKTYLNTLPSFIDACADLRILAEENDLEKYLDVYEITTLDLQEAALGYSESEFEDAENLKSLRIFQYRLSTLRRVFLCSLLALQVDGNSNDFARWKTTVEAMECLAIISGEWAEKLNEILAEEDQFALPSPHRTSLDPKRERLRSQVRKLGSLSQGIRSLQAKMQILREECNRSLEHSEDVTELGSSLMGQYDSIGADLKSLVQAWESGRNSLALNIDRHERRISQASSGLRSPAPSLGGLTAVEEGGPLDALRALNGEIPPQSIPSSLSDSGSEKEVFEAIAMPRQRHMLSREERIAKFQEEEARRASIRVQRETSANMLKELQSVISLRQPKRPNPRITSI